MKVKLTWNKKVGAISFLALSLFFLLCVSYAYFTATVEGNDKAEKVKVTSGTMALKLIGPEEEVTAENMVPGDYKEIEFSVQNTGNVETTYNIDMINVINTFATKSDLVYSIESTSGGGLYN